MGRKFREQTVNNLFVKAIILLIEKRKENLFDENLNSMIN